MSEILSTVPLPVLIILAVLIVISIIYMGYSYLRDHTMDQIRGDVYQLILRAEHMYYESGQGMQKLKYVVQRARSMLPTWLQLVVSEEMLQKIIQVWFDEVKDLLDDGKVNGSNINSTE